MSKTKKKAASAPPAEAPTPEEPIGSETEAPSEETPVPADPEPSDSESAETEPADLDDDREVDDDFDGAGFIPGGEVILDVTATQAERQSRGDYYVMRDVQRQMKHALFGSGPGDIQILITKR